MKIAILKETQPEEARMAVTPETITSMRERGWQVCMQVGCGERLHINDGAYSQAGAQLSSIPLEIIADADIVVKVQPSLHQDNALDELALMKEGALLIGILSPDKHPALLSHYQNRKISAFSLELMVPTIRSQPMLVAASQGMLAGYKAAMDATSRYNRPISMMTTSCGTIMPAKILILGTGFAGLQAMATAKRLGGLVSAYGSEQDSEEKIKSLGVRYLPKLSDSITSEQDIIISTMNEELGRTRQGALILRITDHYAARLPIDATHLYAQNILHFITYLTGGNPQLGTINLDDPIIASTLLTHEGAIIHPLFREHHDGH